jgi:hypothetical protein
LRSRNRAGAFVLRHYLILIVDTPLRYHYGFRQIGAAASSSIMCVANRIRLNKLQILRPKMQIPSHYEILGNAISVSNPS